MESFLLDDCFGDYAFEVKANRSAIGDNIHRSENTLQKCKVGDVNSWAISVSE